MTEYDGPFHIMPVRETREMIRRGYLNRRDYAGAADVIDFPENSVRLTGASGAAMLCNTNRCLYKAGVPNPGRQR